MKKVSWRQTNAPVEKDLDASTLSIEGMSCASCVARVEKALLALPGVKAARVNFANETAFIDHRSNLAATDLINAVQGAGYKAQLKAGPLTPSGKGGDLAAERQRVALKRQLIIAAVLTAPVFILEMGSHLIPAFHHFLQSVLSQGQNWTWQFLLTTLVLAWPGRFFFQKGFSAL